MKKITEAESILNQLIIKGGVFGKVASLHTDNKEKAKQLILECATQCNTKLAVEFWGDELIKKIINFSKLTSV